MAEKNNPGGGKIVPISAADCGAFVNVDTMERFIASFERSSRRWELVVYPALFAFMVLAAYGFYLVFSLTHDMRVIATSIDNNVGAHIESLATNMGGMSQDVNTMSDTVSTLSDTVSTLSDTVSAMGEHVNAMSQQISTMTTYVEVMANRMESLETLAPMLAEIRSLDDSVARLDKSVADMNVSTDLIRYDMRVLTHEVGRPMSRFNSFMP